MKNKLTLRLEESLIRKAKQYARERGTSVSQLVADYFTVISEQQNPDLDIEELPPVTASLSGILSNAGPEEKEYKKYLEEKYLK